MRPNKPSATKDRNFAGFRNCGLAQLSEGSNPNRLEEAMNSLNSDPHVAMSVYQYNRNADIRRAADFRRAAEIRRARTPAPMTDRTNRTTTAVEALDQGDRRVPGTAVGPSPARPWRIAKAAASV